MLYRFLEPDDETRENDEIISKCTWEWKLIDRVNWGKPARLAGKYQIRRPVPEPRPVDDLTDDEITSLNTGFFHGGNMRNLLYVSDEIRARPWETEKEKWIRERLKDIVARFVHVDVYKKDLSETWDAAYKTIK